MRPTSRAGFNVPRLDESIEIVSGLREGDVEYHLVSTVRPPESVLLEILRGPLRRHVRIRR